MLLSLYILLLIAQILLCVALIAFLWQCTVLLISNGLDVPFVPTPRKLYPRIADVLDIRKADIVYDLGCGSGAFLLYCARRYPEARFVGIERNPLLYIYALLRKKAAGRTQNLEYRRGNFYTSDFSDATRIYAFLLPKIMDALFGETKLRGVRVVSRAFEIKSMSPIQTMQLAEKSFFGEHVLRVYEL